MQNRTLSGNRPVDRDAGGAGSFYAAGIYGQYLWLDPTLDVAIAKLSCLPEPDDLESWVEHVTRFREICEGLGGGPARESFPILGHGNGLFWEHLTTTPLEWW